MSTPIAGLSKGIRIFEKSVNSEHPSIRPAKSSSSGMLDEYCLIKKIPNGLAANGMITPKYESIHFSFTRTRKRGINIP